MHVRESGFGGACTCPRGTESLASPDTRVQLMQLMQAGFPRVHTGAAAGFVHPRACTVADREGAGEGVGHAPARKEREKVGRRWASSFRVKVHAWRCVNTSAAHRGLPAVAVVSCAVSISRTAALRSMCRGRLCAPTCTQPALQHHKCGNRGAVGMAARSACTCPPPALLVQRYTATQPPCGVSVCDKQQQHSGHSGSCSGAWLKGHGCRPAGHRVGQPACGQHHGEACSKYGTWRYTIQRHGVRGCSKAHVAVAQRVTLVRPASAGHAELVANLTRRTGGAAVHVRISACEHYQACLAVASRAAPLNRALGAVQATR